MKRSALRAPVPRPSRFAATEIAATGCRLVLKDHCWCAGRHAPPDLAEGGTCAHLRLCSRLVAFARSASPQLRATATRLNAISRALANKSGGSFDAERASAISGFELYVTFAMTQPSMLTAELHSSLVYLDRDFVAGKYEITSGQSPSSQITKTQGKKAGAAIPIFSAEVSAVETRSFPISTLEMLAAVMPVIGEEGEIDPSTFRRNMPSHVGWVTATLGTLTARPSKGVQGTPTYEQGEEQGCFTLQRGSAKLALITTPDYFVSGLDALLKMHKVLLRDLTMPVRAFVRVIAAQNYMDDWVAIPYVMYEHSDDEGSAAA